MNSKGMVVTDNMVVSNQGVLVNTGGMTVSTGNDICPEEALSHRI